jgi:hypothetical protein
MMDTVNTAHATSRKLHTLSSGKINITKDIQLEPLDVDNMFHPQG